MDLLLEGNLLDYAKEKYYNFKGETTAKDFAKSGATSVVKGDDMILNPINYGESIAPQENAMLNKHLGGNALTQDNYNKAIQGVGQEIRSIVADPNDRKEQTDILTAMMRGGDPSDKTTVRYSDSFNAAGSNEPINSVAAAEAGFNKTAIEQMKAAQNNSNFHDLANRHKAALMNSDKLPPLSQHKLMGGGAGDMMENIPTDDFDFI